MANSSIKKLLIGRNEAGLCQQVEKELLAHLEKIMGDRPELTNARCTIKSHDFLCAQTLQDHRNIREGNEINTTRRYHIRTVGPNDFDPWSFMRSDLFMENGGAKENFRVDGSTHTTACRGCAGSGQVPCHRCNSAGTVPCHKCNASGRTQCSSCDGKGRRECWSCGGKGYKTEGYGDDRRTRSCTSCSGGSNPCSNCNSSGSVTCSTCAGRTRLTCPTCDGRTTVDCGSCAAFGSHNDFIYVQSRLERTIKKKFLTKRPEREVTNWSFERDELLMTSERQSLVHQFEKGHLEVLDGFLEAMTKNSTGIKTVRWRAIKATQHDYSFSFELDGDKFELDIDSDGNWSLPSLVANRLVAEASSRLKFDAKLKHLLGMRQLMVEQVPELEEQYAKADDYVKLSDLMDQYTSGSDEKKDNLIDAFAEFKHWKLTDFRRSAGIHYTSQRSIRLWLLGSLSLAAGGIIFGWSNMSFGAVLILLSCLPRKKRIQKLVGHHLHRKPGKRSFILNYIVWPFLLAFMGVIMNGALDQQDADGNQLPPSDQVQQDFFDAGFVLYWKAFRVTGGDVSRIMVRPPELRQMLNSFNLTSEYEKWSAQFDAIPNRDRWRTTDNRSDSVLVLEYLNEYDLQYFIAKGTEYVAFEDYAFVSNGWKGRGAYGPRLANRDIPLNLSNEQYSEMSDHTSDQYWSIPGSNLGVVREVKYENISVERGGQKIRFIPFTLEGYMAYRQYNHDFDGYLPAEPTEPKNTTPDNPAVEDLEDYKALFETKRQALLASYADLEVLQPSEISQASFGQDVSSPSEFNGANLFDNSLTPWNVSKSIDPDGIGRIVEIRWKDEVEVHSIHIVNGPWGDAYSGTARIDELRLTYENQMDRSSIERMIVPGLGNAELDFQHVVFEEPVLMNNLQIRIMRIIDPEFGSISALDIWGSGSELQYEDVAGNLVFPEMILLGKHRGEARDDALINQVDPEGADEKDDRAEATSEFWIVVKEGKSNVNVRKTFPSGKVIGTVNSGDRIKASKALQLSDPMYLLKKESIVTSLDGKRTFKRAASYQLQNVESFVQYIEADVKDNNNKTVRVRIPLGDVELVEQDIWYYLPEMDGYIFGGLVRRE